MARMCQGSALCRRRFTKPIAVATSAIEAEDREVVVVRPADDREDGHRREDDGDPDDVDPAERDVDPRRPCG